MRISHRRRESSARLSVIDRIVVASADLAAIAVRNLRPWYPTHSVTHASRRVKAARRSILVQARRRATKLVLRLSLRGMRLAWRSVHTPVGRRIIRHWLDASSRSGRARR
jgi:hypothetical protein